MKDFTIRVVLGCGLCTALSSAASAQSLSMAAPPTLFEDLSKGQAKFLNEEFPQMVRDFTGLDAKLIRRDNLNQIGDNLDSGTDSFALLQGVEYGWLKEKHPKVEPLLVGFYHVSQPRAALMAKKDDAGKSFADFKGRPIALLKAGKEHVYLFEKKGAGGDPAKFFSKIITTSNGEACLDDVLLGKAAAAIVDDAALAEYKDVNPGRFQRLRIVEQSTPFPPMGIFYVPGKVPAETVEKVRAGMLKANNDSRGRDSMATFRITSFEPVPKEYPTWAAEVIKAYPQAE
jgi:ABC-type phosphate/phosphonate transport system substrate-binding protein